jgi:peptidoglycan-associated lipoprotein
VTGKVPNKKTYDSIVNTILGTKDIDQLDKTLKIGEDVKEDTYLEPLPEFISSFYNGSVKKREFRLKNKELTLRGVLPSKEAKANTLALADPLKKMGVKIIDLLTVEEPKVVVMVPKNPDPNKDGTSQPGKDPVSPRPAFDPEKGELHSIYFDTGEFHIRESQKSRAEELLVRARDTGGKIVIDGFADERGSDELNAFLSDQRANRIRNYLISNGIDRSRIVSVVGRGEVPNGNKYEKYRRTDVRIIK